MVGTDNTLFTQHITPPQPPLGHRPGGFRIRFSHQELRHISIATAVLTGAFWLLFARPQGISPISDPIASILLAVVSLVAVVSGFLFHEMGHKVTAQYFGCWAEFRYSQWGLILTLLTAVFGFLFAIPGAVYFAGNVTKRQNGLIGLAGPGVNLVTSIILWPVYLILATFGSGGMGILVPGIGVVLFVNTFLGAFNMIPFGPLDGRKVWGWSPGIFGVTMAVMLTNAIAAYFVVF